MKKLILSLVVLGTFLLVGLSDLNAQTAQQMEKFEIQLQEFEKQYVYLPQEKIDYYLEEFQTLIEEMDATEAKKTELNARVASIWTKK